MVIIRVYPVMSKIQIELSCVHHVDPAASHMVYRTLAYVESDSLWEELMVVAEEVHRCARMLERGELEDYDDCPL